jgi:chromosome partitioning protein
LKEVALATQHAHEDTRKDGHVDSCVEEHVDSRVDGGKASAGSRRAIVIVLANHKGGVTKTTSTANLGAMLAKRGCRVLVVDCDPQANLSEAFGWTEEVVGTRLEDLIAHPEAASGFAPPAALGADVKPMPGWRELLRILPCTDLLADEAADLPASVGEGYEYTIRSVVEAQRGAFDVILLDTPPGLGNLSGMAMLAADLLLIPSLAADLDIRAAGKVYDLVESEVPGLRILGVLIAASERRWRVTREAVARLEEDGMRVFPFHVPRAVRVASAPRHHAPISVLEPDSLIAQAYRNVAAHLLELVAG